MHPHQSPAYTSTNAGQLWLWLLETLTRCSATAHDAALYVVCLVLVLLASFVSDVQVNPVDGMFCCQDCRLVTVA